MSTATIGPHTIDDLLRTPEGEKWELIDGELTMVEERGKNIDLATVLARKIGNYLEDNPLGKIAAGGQFSFSSIEHPKSRAVVPDVNFIPMGELSKYDPDANIQTDVIPSLVVEILSPSTRGDDLGSKKEIYREAGVEEYWVIDIESEEPGEQKVMRFRLQEDPDRPKEIIPFTGTLTSSLFPKFALDLEEVSRELRRSYRRRPKP